MAYPGSDALVLHHWTVARDHDGARVFWDLASFHGALGLDKTASQWYLHEWHAWTARSAKLGLADVHCRKAQVTKQCTAIAEKGLDIPCRVLPKPTLSSYALFAMTVRSAAPTAGRLDKNEWRRCCFDAFLLSILRTVASGSWGFTLYVDQHVRCSAGWDSRGTCPLRCSVDGGAVTFDPHELKQIPRTTATRSFLEFLESLPLSADLAEFLKRASVPSGPIFHCIWKQLVVIIGKKLDDWAAQRGVSCAGDVPMDDAGHAKEKGDGATAKQSRKLKRASADRLRETRASRLCQYLFAGHHAFPLQRVVSVAIDASRVAKRMVFLIVLALNSNLVMWGPPQEL